MADERPAKRARTDDQPATRKGSSHQEKKWKSQRGGVKGRPNVGSSGIHANDVGIFVTCDRGQERKCLNEMHDLLSQYLEGLDSDLPNHDNKPAHANDGEDVEADIQAELSELRSDSNRTGQIQLITLDVPCISFIRLSQDVDPVDLVHRICLDAYNDPARKRSRFIKRITPVSLLCKTLSGGLDELCDQILKPHFHKDDSSFKFAIRPTIRNNDKLDRDAIIQVVAKAVGTNHKVDLKGYDKMILVDVYRNIIGMSVVGSDYDKLKKYNLAEIYQPTPKPIKEPPAKDNVVEETRPVGTSEEKTGGEFSRDHAVSDN